MAPRPLIDGKASQRGRGAVESITGGGVRQDEALERNAETSGTMRRTKRSIAPPQEEVAGQYGTRSAGARHAPSSSAGNPSMGYGGYGMMPMGGMGYGYGYGAMGYGGMGMMGPMSMIYSINYFISTIGQFASMIGMSTHAVGHLLSMARENLLKLEKTVRQSEWRRWLQRKSEKSALFRWALILASMLAASQVVRLARYLIEVQLRRNGGALLTQHGEGHAYGGSSSPLRSQGLQREAPSAAMDGV